MKLKPNCKKRVTLMPLQICKRVIILFAVFLTSIQLSSQGLHVTGYADFEAIWNNPAGDGDSEFYFDNHHFNVIVHGAIYGDLFAGAEIEYEHAGEEIALEYGYLGYTGIKNMRIMAGKFIIPFGRFNKDLHPTWINKMIDRPHGFKDIFPQTYSDVGIWLTGAIPLKNGNRIAYDAFAVNGLMGTDGDNIRNMRDNDREKLPGGGKDNNKSLGGRLGLELAPLGFDIGASIYNGEYSDNPDSSLNLMITGIDAAYRKGSFEMRAELIHAIQEVSNGDDLKKTGGYAQVSYLINSIYEPVIRFSTRDMPGENQDLSRLSFGINYYLSGSSVIRLNYHVNTEKSDFESDNDNMAIQFTTYF